MQKKLIYITFPFILLAGIYFLGPAPESPKWDSAMPRVPQDATELEKYVASQEGRHKLKPDNEARIVWSDSSKKRTEYSVVYLHGFSASQEEGAPIHRAFAKKFGCNLYLARMADHGIDTTEQLLYFTPDRWWQSSKEALAIGKVLGEKVIIMSTSTGGTMALMLAAEYSKDVFALINMSPNISLFHPMAWIGNNPWGLQIARLVVGDNYNVQKPIPGVDMKLQNQYWNDKYRLEAVCQMQEMLESKMTKATFQRVKQPSLSLYYYKNQAEQDSTVKVSAILEMNKQLATPDSLKEAVAIPGAGTHVIGSYIRAKDIAEVESEINRFATEKLKLRPDFGIKPMRLEFYKASVASNPQNQLVELEKFIPGIVLDIKYATTDNFTKERIYNLAKAYARKPVAEALKKAGQEFNKLGYGVKIFDGYRPYSATVKFYEVMKGDTTYVANPYKGSRHNRGCALDMTLFDLKTKKDLKMPTEYDAMQKEAFPTAPVSDVVARKNRETLISVMEHNGFKVYSTEWWHFDFVGFEKFPVMDINFEELIK